MTPQERVEALRKRHRIVVRYPHPDVQPRCYFDGVRVHPTKVGYRHDIAEMEALNKAAAGQEVRI